ncbi:MAG: hypothetical protein ACKVWR_23110 [Acidimicrobiales bacterium]
MRRWARDALHVAEAGAVALVVVTAVGRALDARTDGEPVAAPAAVAAISGAEVRVTHAGALGVVHASPALHGPLRVEVEAADGQVAAEAAVTDGRPAVFTGLAPGAYRLILSREGPVEEGEAGVLLSAAALERTQPIELGAGDVLTVVTDGAG